MPHSSRLFFTFAMRNTPCRESYRAHRGPLGPQIQDAQAKDRVQQSAARFQARSGRAHSSGVHRICFSKGLPFQTDKAFAKGKWLNLQVWFIWISFYIIIFFFDSCMSCSCCYDLYRKGLENGLSRNGVYHYLLQFYIMVQLTLLPWDFGWFPGKSKRDNSIYCHLVPNLVCLLVKS